MLTPQVLKVGNVEIQVQVMEPVRRLSRLPITGRESLASKAHRLLKQIKKAAVREQHEDYGCSAFGIAKHLGVSYSVATQACLVHPRIRCVSWSLPSGRTARQFYAA